MIATHVKPADGRKLGGGQEETRLADPRLALQRDRGQASGRVAQLLADRVELGASPDDRACCPAQLHGERALRADERVERAAIGGPDGRFLVQRSSDHPAWRGLWGRVCNVRATLASGRSSAADRYQIKDYGIDRRSRATALAEFA